MPFNGRNSNSIVVMDNGSIHHCQEVAALIASIGALSIYLPPYTPDLNPTEKVFHLLYAYLKAHKQVVNNGSDIETIVQAAFTTIGPQDYNGWFSDYGYFTVTRLVCKPQINIDA